jgi:hypothetical protein
MRQRSCPKIQTCPTCGRMRGHHQAGLYSCPVSKEVTDTVKAFASENGPRWRSKLCDMWANGSDSDSPDLRQARNLIGPTNLYKITI